VIVQIAHLKLNGLADQAEMVMRIDRSARHICRNAATHIKSARCAAETVEYTLAIAPVQVRQANIDASDRRESFALAQN